MDDPPPIPAATLILFREVARGAPQLLMIERARTLAFAAGAVVFPGGRVDPGDQLLAQDHDLPHAAARIAAIRETIEETGLAPALAPVPSAEVAAALRGEMAAGQPFGTLLARYELSLDLRALTPFARWQPNFREARRFDAMFFIARAPAGEPSADNHEAVRAVWISAVDMLAEIEAGRSQAIFPTRRNLERLARFASFAEAEADARLHPIETITPWVEERGGKPHLCIPEGRGYPVTSELLETARRS